MARNQDDWKNHLDMTAEGFFKSFWAIPLSFPFMLTGQFFYYRLIRNYEELPDSPLFDLPISNLLIKDSILFFISWMVSVIILLAMSRSVKAGSKVTPLVVSYNWLGLLLFGLFALVGLLGSPTADPTVFALLWLVAGILGIYLRWGAFRRSLEASVSTVLVLLVMLFLVGLAVELFINNFWLMFFEPKSFIILKNSA